MKILFIVPYAPTPIRTRPYNLLRALKERGHQITLATLWQTELEREALSDFKRMGIEVLTARLTIVDIARNAMRALISHTPIQAAYCWQSAIADCIYNALAKLTTSSTGAEKVVHVEHLRGARYGLRLNSEAPTVWDSVDCISYLFEQASRHSTSPIRRWLTAFELERTRRYEGWLVHQFERTLVTSYTDKAALEKLVPIGRSDGETLRSIRGTFREPSISVLPNGVDLQYFRPVEGPREADALVLSGKMSYHANVTAVHYFVREVLPLIWAKRPQTQLWIVGQNPPASLKSLTADSRIVVTGYVPDIRPYLCRAAVAICPVTYGAGIQNKILEAMSCATAVVSRSLATLALGAKPGHEILVADSNAEFAHQVLNLLSNPALAEQIGRAGREYVERQHGWPAIVSQLEKNYREAILSWRAHRPL